MTARLQMTMNSSESDRDEGKNEKNADVKREKNLSMLSFVVCASICFS